MNAVDILNCSVPRVHRRTTRKRGTAEQAFVWANHVCVDNYEFREFMRAWFTRDHATLKDEWPDYLGWLKTYDGQEAKKEGTTLEPHIRSEHL